MQSSEELQLLELVVSQVCVRHIQDLQVAELAKAVAIIALNETLVHGQHSKAAQASDTT